MAELAPNLVIVTLAVSDLERSIAFYRGLGWEQRGDQSQGIVWFRTSGPWLGLFGADELASDAGLTTAELPPFRGITLALNLPSEGDVDEAIDTVRALGAEVVKEPVRAEWGGYSGYFADPDGHLWELCCNPGFPLDDQGRIEIA
jgi:catechol 2,3-dioxygenase-like lactoylglutathione lyase family enzyme